MNKSKRSDSFNYILKFIAGIILSLLIYGINSQLRSNQKSIDIESILPPTGSILKSIAISRVSGTRSNENVRKFIKSQFNPAIWDIEEDSHVIESPLGKSTPFTNLIITYKTTKHDQKRLILAAHFDSKFLEAESLQDIPQALESKFIGATDSAWSCSLLIYIAKSLEQVAYNFKSRNLQLIFFDGEEAIKHWSSTDSLYGSRALASKWSKLPLSHPNSLQNIDLMVLLDLLGSSDGSNFYSFHSENSKIDGEFKKLIEIERKLFPNGTKFFQESPRFKGVNGMAVEDDHVPFLPLGVPVLHLIPLPFPSAWHTQKDTIDALDPDTCRKLTNILFEYMKSELT